MTFEESQYIQIKDKKVKVTYTFDSESKKKLISRKRSIVEDSEFEANVEKPTHVVASSGDFWRAFYVLPDEILTPAEVAQRKQEKINFLADPRINTAIGGTQDMEVSIESLIAVELDLDDIYNENIIGDVPYNRMKAALALYKSQVRPLNL
jgi:leucyl aminopeptidase